jgi:hypothetical protein
MEKSEGEKNKCEMWGQGLTFRYQKRPLPYNALYRKERTSSPNFEGTMYLSMGHAQGGEGRKA